MIRRVRSPFEVCRSPRSLTRLTQGDEQHSLAFKEQHLASSIVCGTHGAFLESHRFTTHNKLGQLLPRRIDNRVKDLTWKPRSTTLASTRLSHRHDSSTEHPFRRGWLWGWRWPQSTASTDVSPLDKHRSRRHWTPSRRRS